MLFYFFVDKLFIYIYENCILLKDCFLRFSWNLISTIFYTNVYILHTTFSDSINLLLHFYHCHNYLFNINRDHLATPL